ncbi:MAG: energy-coupling factor transporter transmembrane protein EcfT [Lachnospiraceae bacterium]|nr:energy-coupling factor transporter transmembrane protein EcfT [Lachnospiraceae bacterium]
MKGVVLGQYYPGDSLIHSLDPRVKIVSTFVFIISLFVVDNVPGYAVTALFLVSAVALSKVPVARLIKGLSGILVLMVFTAVFNLFLTPGEVVFSFYSLQITREGIIVTVKMLVRLVFLIMGSSLMTYTTTPSALADALESLMKPLKVVKVPVHEISMMISIALRFIPILAEEADIIIKAQKARCADFDTGSVIKRAKAMIPVLVPLFVSAFRRANDLAVAMEARCYRGGDNRTRMRPLTYCARDYRAYAVDAALLLGCILTRVIL